MISKWNTERGNVGIGEVNDRQKSGSSLVNSSTTFIDAQSISRKKFFLEDLILQVTTT